MTPAIDRGLNVGGIGLLRRPVGVALLLAAAWITACGTDEPGIVDLDSTPDTIVPSDSSVAVDPAESEFHAIVSDPVAGGSVSVLSVPAGAWSPQLAEADEVVYVSLQPGTFDEGSEAVVTHRRLGTRLSIPLLDGGFDPVAVRGSAGDTLDFDVLRGPTEIVTWNEVVPASSPPSVIRTYPARGKRQVPVALSPMVVFSEPMGLTVLDGTGIQLLLNGSAVPGSVAFTDGTQITATFVPDAPLADTTTYELVTTRQSTDLDADPLEVEERVAFTTGLSDQGRLAFLVQPSNAVAGETVSPPVQVAILDSVGAVDGSRSDTVTLERDLWAGDGRVSGTVAVAAVNGVATFADLSVDKPPVAWVNNARVLYTLVASAPGLGSTTSAPFDIVSGTAARLEFDWLPPTHTFAGLRMHHPLYVAPRDSLGNDVETFDGRSVTLALVANASGGTLTVRNAPSGYGAEFYDIRIDRPGAGYVLVAWAPGVASAVSQPFDVVAPDDVIAFDGGWGLSITSPDGQATALLDADLDGTHPAWSPDGSKLTYANQGQLYVINADGTGRTHVGTGELPAWSPDGNWIAFVRGFGPNSQIHVMSPDGSSVTWLAGGYGPAWSPDGATIAFSRGGEILTMKPDGSDVTHVADGAGRPAWSPDGSRLAYTCANALLCLIDGDGTNESMPFDRLGNWECAHDPSWSPDGTRIAFAADCSSVEPAAVLVLELSGSQPPSSCRWPLTWSGVPACMVAGFTPTLNGGAWGNGAFYPAWRPARP